MCHSREDLLINNVKRVLPVYECHESYEEGLV